jgi:hypothetical protein
MSMSNLDAFKAIKEKFNSPSAKTEEVFSSKSNVIKEAEEIKEVERVGEVENTSVIQDEPKVQEPQEPQELDSELDKDTLIKSDVESAKAEEVSNQLNQINNFIDETYSKYADIIQDINVKHIDTLENNDPLFKYKIIIRDKTIEFRKWKVKDRKSLMAANNDVERRKALVYNCIKDQNVALDNEEFNFVLEKIRSVSVKDKLNYTLTCDECGKDFNLSVDIEDLIDCSFSDFEPLVYNDLIIEIQDIKNRDFYENTIITVTDEQERFLYDLALHIKSINGNSSMSFQSVIDFLQDLDLDVYSSIYEQFNKIRFRCINLQSVECPHCHGETVFNFNDFPGFFPKSWE